MNVMQARIALRERSFLDVLDLSAKFFFAHKLAFARLALIVLAPSFALSLAIASEAGWAWGWVAAFALSLTAQVPFTVLGSQLVFAERVRLREVLTISFNAMPRIVLARVLQVIAGAGILLGTSLFFVVEIIVLERDTAGRALARSRRLAAASAGDVFLAMIVLGLVLPFAATAIFDAAGRAMLESLFEVSPPASLFHDGGGALSLLGFWLCIPFGATARFLLYLNLRTRSEGWDIQTRFASLAARTRLVPLAAVLAASLAASTVHAGTLDPSHAEADIAQLREGGRAGFCTRPARPLSARARALCPHAAQIPGCDALVTACAEDATTAAKKSASEPSDESSASRVPPALGEIARALVWLLFVGVACAIAIPIVLALLRMRRDKTLAEKLPDIPVARALTATAHDIVATSDAEQLLRRADERAQKGELDLALHLYLGAALRALDARGTIRISKDRTNGEYVRACRDDASRAPLREIVREVDLVQFGGKVPSSESVDHAAKRAVALVRALPIALFALAALTMSLFACDAPRTRATGTNPAGDELLVELLRKQGVHVSNLGSSLASIAIPKAGEPRPTVIVDVGSTPLDEDTRDHLMRWVNAGGTLVLAASPSEWPAELLAHGALPAPTRDAEGGAADVVIRTRMIPLTEDDRGLGEYAATYISRAHASVVERAALEWDRAEMAAVFAAPANAGSKEAIAGVYAGLARIGEGIVLGVASDELLTNVGLTRAGNAEAAIALLSNIEETNRTAPWEIKIARAEDGIAPPSNPVAGLTRAGLGLGMWHALAASLVLFLAVGLRLTRARPTPPPARRAFTEHVEATGALYARTHVATHALAAYTRFAEERLYARMPRTARPGLAPGVVDTSGVTDIATFLAARTKAPLADCIRVWQRAKNVRAEDPPRGDELEILKRLSALYAAAMSR